MDVFYENEIRRQLRQDPTGHLWEAASDTSFDELYGMAQNSQTRPNTTSLLRFQQFRQEVVSRGGIDSIIHPFFCDAFSTSNPEASGDLSLRNEGD
jgi:hypothetical protein